MSPLLLLALGLALDPGAAPARIKLISLDLKGSNVAAEDLSLLSGLVAVELGAYESLDVVSGAEVRQLVELEGDKQMLGCEASASCLAEIAGALGARLVAFGEVGKLGNRYVLNLSLHDSRTNRSVGRASLQGDSIEAIADGMADAIATLVVPFLAEAQLSTTTARRIAPSRAEGAWLSPTAGITAIVGAVVLVGSYAASGIAPRVAERPSTKFRDTLLIPFAGPFIAIADQYSGGETQVDDGFYPGETEDTLVLLGLGIGQGVGALAATIGGVAWAVTGAQQE